MGTDTPPLRRILVVDDSSVARKIVVRCLRGLGYDEVEFDEAEHGQAALDLLREREPDLIVTDLNMPVMDGVSMLRRIKASPRLQHIPVIVVSSVLNEARKRELVERGVDLLVEKPVSPPDLAAAIERIEKWETR
ncbi:MAG: response regulator [Myxococcales bacterium]|nr:response regulator [Myxococcales bacterium]